MGLLFMMHVRDVGVVVRGALSKARVAGVRGIVGRHYVAVPESCSRLEPSPALAGLAVVVIERATALLVILCYA